MPATIDPLDWTFYHNTAREWLIALAIASVVFTTLAIIRRVLRRRFAAPAAAGRPDSTLARSIRHTRYFFMLAVALDLASNYLQFPPKVERAIAIITTLLIFLQVGLWFNDIVGFLLQRYATRRAAEGDVQSPTTVVALGIAARGVLWILLTLIALDNLGVHIQTLVAGLGISGIAIALAVQNVLGDAFAALSIVTDKPFVIGDSISVDTFSGTVEHIGLKTTRLRSVTGEELIFSNADLLKSRIRNWKRMHERGVSLITRVGYETPRTVIDRLPQVMREIVERQQPVRFVRSHIRALTDAAVEIETFYFVESADYGVYMDVQQAIAIATLERFGELGVVIATPLHTIVMRADPNWNAASNADNGSTPPAAPQTAPPASPASPPATAPAIPPAIPAAIPAASPQPTR